MICLGIVLNLLSFSFIPLVYAANDGVQEDFINFYAGSSGTALNIENLKTQDYYVLSVFMSNYFEPGVTTLADLISPNIENNSFYSNFATSLQKENDDSLKKAVSSIGNDIKNVLETGNCTLIRANDNNDTVEVTGKTFLREIVRSVDLVDEDVLDVILKSEDKDGVNINNSGEVYNYKSNITDNILRNRILYYGQVDENHIAMDFSSPAFRAALQVLAGYNNTLFLDSRGIESLSRIFLDPFGNIWGIRIKDESVKSKLNSVNSLSGLLTASLGEGESIGSNVFLILPACLNPATFSPKVTDVNELRMPLMNRFTLGCILTNDGLNHNGSVYDINENFVPFYNILNFDSFSKYDKSLVIFGLNTLSPFTGNIGGYVENEGTGKNNGIWDINSNWKGLNTDIANFGYDSGLITLDESVVNGIGDFGTRSYIVFAPNPKSIDGSNKKNTSPEGNMALDLDEFKGFSDGRAFITSFTNNDIQKILDYLYTANFLTLNQVSMNFFSDLNVSNSTNPSKDISSQIINDKDDTILGMKSLSLFFTTLSNSFDIETTSGKHKYRGIVMESLQKSKLTQNLSEVFNNIDIETYTKLIENMSGCKDDILIELTAIKESDSDLADYAHLFIDILNGGVPTDGIEYLKNIFPDAIFKSFEEDKDIVALYLQPKGFLYLGNAAHGDVTTKDIALTNTATLNDFGLSQVLGFYSRQSTSGNVGDDAYLVISSKDLIPLLLGLYEYTVFTPTTQNMQNMLTSYTTVTNTQKSLFGTDKTFMPNIDTHTFDGNQNVTMGIYFGYIIDMLGISIDNGTEEKEATLNCFGFNSKFLPKFSNISAKGGEMVFGGDLYNTSSGVVFDEDTSFEEKQKDLINRIYGLTNDRNNDYRNSLIKSILEGFILTLHRTVTGTWGSAINTVVSGSTSTYKSVTGYIYTPTLEELPFTATLMNNYLKIYVFCFVIILFLLILMTLLNMRSWQQSVLIGIMMSVALLFPYILISNTISISNKISNNIYSDRFDFWALVELQENESKLVGLEGMSDKSQFLAISSATSDTTYMGNAGVKIKWMSPKKVDMFNSIYSDKSLSESFVTNIQIFKWLFNSFIYDSEFVDTEIYGSYVYRPFKNIAIEGNCYYEWANGLYSSLNQYQESDIDLISSVGLSEIEIPKILNDSLKVYKNNEYSKYIPLMARYDNSIYMSNTTDYLDYSEDMVSDIEKIKPLNYNNGVKDVALWGIVNSDITERINQDVTDSTVGIISNLPVSDSKSAFNNASTASISKAIYLKNTESPFYYFYSVLKTEFGDDFKKDLLKSENFRMGTEDIEQLSDIGQYRVTKGDYKDFLDMEGLFTGVIPYLNDGNKYVKEWRNIYGSEIEQYDFEYTVDESGNVQIGESNNVIEKEDMASVAYQEAVERKNNQNKVWNMYAPWVDSLYELDVLNKRVKVGNKRISISDTLNPYAYLKEGRPMIFSEADMALRGYTYKDLTDIERRIQSVTEKTYLDLMYLINYYDLNNDVLLSAAAMYATFNFNSEFSQNSFLGNDVLLYPQGFELKNFNYDAFMRLALLNSTGENVFDNSDLYERVLSKTSIITGLFLIICDLVACILIPLFKFIIIVGLLFLGVLICVVCVVNPPEKIFESVNKSLLLPTILFMALNIVFSWVMSLLVGEGLTAYVGSKSVNFATNDPTITMLLMALLGVAYVFFCWKILKFLISAYKQFGLSTALAAVGIVGAAIAQGTSGIAKKVTSGISATTGSIIGAATAGKGNRISGAFEGRRLGAGGVVDRRIRDRKFKDLLSGNNGDIKDIKNKIDGLATQGGSTEEDEEDIKTPKNPEEPKNPETSVEDTGNQSNKEGNEANIPTEPIIEEPDADVKEMDNKQVGYNEIKENNTYSNTNNTSFNFDNNERYTGEFNSLKEKEKAQKAITVQVQRMPKQFKQNQSRVRSKNRKRKVNGARQNGVVLTPIGTDRVENERKEYKKPVGDSKVHSTDKEERVPRRRGVNSFEDKRGNKVSIDNTEVYTSNRVRETPVAKKDVGEKSLNDSHDKISKSRENGYSLNDRMGKDNGNMNK